MSTDNYAVNSAIKDCPKYKDARDLKMPNLYFSCVKFGSFIWICDLIARRFGNSAGEKYGVRVS